MISWGRPGLLSLLALTSACAPTVGSQCDMTAAQTVVYNRSTGTPAFEGQSLMITSCASGGSFCHTDTAQQRFAAPHGMNFDPVLADSLRFGNAGDPQTSLGTRHLLESRRAMIHFRNDIFAQVSSGAMPPRGIGDTVTRIPYRRFTDESDTVGTPVPSIRSAEGREILRNWLACGAPVVERTTDPPADFCSSDADCPLTACDPNPPSPELHECLLVGYIFRRRTVVTEPTWESIYGTVIADGCAIGGCHDAASAPNSGGLDMSSSALAYEQLVHGMAAFPTCGTTRVVPNDPDASFLVRKLDGSALDLDCGVSMPIGDILPDSQVQAIRQWIMDGALP
jgi:hypothetical protein